MNNLKVGDKVVRINEDYLNMRVKDIGTVKEIRMDNNGRPQNVILEEFDGVHMVENLARPTNDKIKVGDKVVRVKGENAGMIVGDVATVKHIFCDVLELEEYRGRHQSDNFLMFKKSETRKCKFKVGEYVKIGKDICGTIKDANTIFTGLVGVVKEVDTTIPQQNSYRVSVRNGEVWLLENELVKLNNTKKLKNKTNIKSEVDELKREKYKLERRIEELEKNIEVVIPDEVINRVLLDGDKDIDLSMIRKGREITCTITCIETGEQLGKGVSKAMITDTFDELIGCKIAYHRCVMNFNKRAMFKLING